MNEKDRKSTFETLEVWKDSSDLRRDISKLVKGFPVEEKYKLTDQMIRASRSVTNNIAEGYGRFHFQENIQFCRESRGSLYELLDHFVIANDEGYINNLTFSEFKSRVDLIIMKLNGYIAYLKKRKQDG